MRLLWLLGAVLALFAAYVVGRAVGILTGIGPWPTTALAMAIVVVLLARRATRNRR